MKKLFVTLALSVACVGAFAQGKVLFGNDPAHLAYMTADTSHLKPADVASATLAAPWIGAGGALPSGTLMVAGLYVGQTAGSLSLITSVPITGTLGPGRIQNVSYVLPAPFAGGTLAYFQVKLWEVGFASYEAAVTASGLNPSLLTYISSTDVFSGTPGGGVTYPPLVGGAFTWVGGTAAFSQFSTVNAVPEPSSMALAGLGAAALMIFRRRK